MSIATELTAAVVEPLVGGRYGVHPAPLWAAKYEYTLDEMDWTDLSMF